RRAEAGPARAPARAPAACRAERFRAPSRDAGPARVPRSAWSAIRVVLAAALAGVGFGRTRRHELVQDRSLAVFPPQDPAQALHVLAHRAATADHDRDAR